MDAFALHREGWTAAAAGRDAVALARFMPAAAAFGRLVTDHDTRVWLERRANLIPQARSRAVDVVDTFLAELPLWLRDAHIHQFQQAFDRRDDASARAFWSFIPAAARIATLAKTFDLAMIRNLICQRLQLNGNGPADDADETTRKVTLAERLLRIDAGNPVARMLVVRAYSGQLGSTIEDLARRPASRKADADSASMLRLPAAKRRKLERSARRQTRALRRHLRHIGRLEIVAAEAADGYLQLARFYGSIGDIDEALGMARRARRLRPQDADLMKLARRLRRARSGR